MSDLEEFILDHGSVTLDHVDKIVHYAPGYDPVKAREYYLRTRELKGRPTGSTEAEMRRPAAKKPAAVAPKKASQKTPLQRRKEVEARVEALKGRLEKLRKVLRELVKQAQARSGVVPKDTKSKTTAGSKKLSATERKEAAKRQEEYRKKHPEKAETLTDQEKRLAEQIKDVNAKIEKARADLKSAVAKARTKPAAKSRQNI